MWPIVGTEPSPGLSSGASEKVADGPRMACKSASSHSAMSAGGCGGKVIGGPGSESFGAGSGGGANEVTAAA